MGYLKISKPLKRLGWSGLWSFYPWLKPWAMEAAIPIGQRISFGNSSVQRFPKSKQSPTWIQRQLGKVCVQFWLLPTAVNLYLLGNSFLLRNSYFQIRIYRKTKSQKSNRAETRGLQRRQSIWNKTSANRFLVTFWRQKVTKRKSGWLLTFEFWPLTFETNHPIFR